MWECSHVLFLCKKIIPTKVWPIALYYYQYWTADYYFCENWRIFKVFFDEYIKNSICLKWKSFIKSYVIDIYQCSASLLNAEFLNSSVLCVFNIFSISSGLPRNSADPQPTWQHAPEGRTCCRAHPDPQQWSSLLHTNHTVRAEEPERVEGGEEHKKNQFPRTVRPLVDSAV